MQPLGKYVFMPSLILHTLIVGEGLLTSDHPEQAGSHQY